VSASLDQTVRVWDIGGLRKKTVAPAGPYSSRGVHFQSKCTGTHHGLTRHPLVPVNHGVPAHVKTRRFLPSYGSTASRHSYVIYRSLWVPFPTGVR